MKPLNPIMAVLVIASVGASPLRTLAADGDNKTAATSADNNPVNALSKILSENSAARKDAGERASKFLLDTVDGKSFVDSGVNTNALGAVAREWGEKEAAGRVAMFYFVAGPGLAVPGWAAKDPILSKTFTTGMKWEGRLRLALADWTGKSRIDKTKEKTQVTAFLNDAADKASKVFDDAREKKEIDLSVEGNDNTGVKPPDTRRSAGTTLDGASRQYTIEDLYQDPGAKWGNVSGPNDKNSRTISMKIYTKRMPDGTTRDEIGIFDITDRNDIFGQRFPIDSGDQSFTLDDRTAGHKKYELKFVTGPDGDRTVTFNRPGGGPGISTSVSELFKMRAAQATGMGNIVTVNGEEFYTLPQGGVRSALALFPKGLLDGPVKDARDLKPTLYAEIGVRGPDGRNVNMPSDGKTGPHLGKVGDKEYRLEFNKDTGVWEVKEGAGTWWKPKEEAPAGGGTGTTGPGGGTTPTEGSMPIADLEALLLKNPDCKKNPDDVKDLAADLKGKYGIVSCTSAIDGLQQIVLVPKSARAPAQQLAYGSVPGYKLQRARFVDHYLVLQFDKQVQYLDLLKQDKDPDGKESGFAVSGIVGFPEKNASRFTDVGVLMDAFRVYMGVTSAEALREVPKRVEEHLKGKPYNLTAAFPKGELVVNGVSGGDVYMFWPKLELPGGSNAAPATSPYTTLSGPANAMDGAVSSVDEKFPDVIDLPESRQAAVMSGRKQADIAMYESKDVTGKPEPKKYFVMFKYDALDPKDAAKPDGAKEKKRFRQKPFEVFSSTNPLPGSFAMQGLVGGIVVKDRVASGYKFVSGSTKEKGVLAVFQNKQVSGDNQKDKPENCVGPVVWWGLADREAALKVCQEDKF